jgi:hypothetical protein
VHFASLTPLQTPHPSSPPKFKFSTTAMFSQRNQSRQQARPAISTSLFHATNAAIDGNIVGTFFHSAAMSNAAQKKVNGLVQANAKPRLTSFEQQRNLFIAKLQEGRRRLARGKKSMGWLVKGEIKATPQQLVGLENRVRQAKNMQALNLLVREVNIALGYLVVAA